MQLVKGRERLPKIYSGFRNEDLTILFGKEWKEVLGNRTQLSFFFLKYFHRSGQQYSDSI